VRAAPGLALLGLLLAPACGSEHTVTLAPPALQAPNPATDGLVLEWPTYRKTSEDRYEIGFHFRLELEPGGRFRYAWRRAGAAPDAWHEVGGSWEKVQDRTHWDLHPDAGRDALETGQFKDWEVPSLRWADSGAVQVGGGAAGALYFVPLLDPETGRFKDSFGIQQDPRVTAWLATLAEDR
jgi:hypothetical protein